MTIHEFKTQEQLDAETELAEQLFFEHLCLKEAVEEAQRELEAAKLELEEFEKEWKL